MSLSARGLLFCGCIWSFPCLLIITGCLKTAEPQRQQKITQTIENQKTIGQAYSEFMTDNNGSYPKVRGAAGGGQEHRQPLRRASAGLLDLRHFARHARLGNSRGDPVRNVTAFALRTCRSQDQG